MSHNDRPFYGAEADNLGIVHALPLRTFRELVERKLNIAVTLNITRERFNTMDKRQRSKAKRVPYIVPCSFQSSPSRRVHEEATTFSLVCIDIDDSVAALPYYNSPGTLMEALSPFNFALYTTASSTPDAPRLRLIVEASALNVTHYKSAIDFVARLIGLTEVTRESYTVVQPMFLPTLFKGDDENVEHPLVVYELDSRAISLKDIQTDFSEPLKAARPEPPVSSMDSDAIAQGSALDFLRPAVDEVTIPIARQAIKHIDPDVTYPEWLEIAAALRHQFPLRQAEPAFNLFNEWSSLGKKYVGEHDCRAKWDSLRPNPSNRVPVTIRTLLTRATNAGWNGGKVRDACFKSTQKWITDEARKTEELMDQGVSRIVTTPLLTLAEEEALLNQLCDQLRRNHQTKVSVATMRKEMRLLRVKLNDKAGKDKPVVVPPWAKGMCYITAMNRFFRNQTCERYTPDELDHAYGRKLLPTQDQLAQAAMSGKVLSPAKPLERPRDYLLNMVKIPVVYDSVYDPRFPSDTFLELDGRACVNLYTPCYPEPSMDEAPHASGIFMQHINNLIAEPEYRQIVLDYMAYIVQFPGRKIRWALLVQGVEGCGKTFIAQALAAVLGKPHVRVVDSSALNSTWNEWAYGAQVIVLEEIRVTGHSRHDAMNALKPLITNDDINLNQRHRDSRQVNNTSNYIAFTNHHDPIIVTAGDRRYFVVKSAMQSKLQVLALGQTYFRRLFGMLETHAAGLRHFLENWPISAEFDADGHAPRTRYLGQLLEDTTGDFEIKVRDAIEDGVHPLINKQLVSATALTAYLETTATGNGYKAPAAPHLAHILREQGYEAYGRATVCGQRHYMWAAMSGAPRHRVIQEAEHLLETWQRLDPDDLALL